MPTLFQAFNFKWEKAWRIKQGKELCYFLQPSIATTVKKKDYSWCVEVCQQQLKRQHNASHIGLNASHIGLNASHIEHNASHMGPRYPIFQQTKIMITRRKAPPRELPIVIAPVVVDCVFPVEIKRKKKWSKSWWSLIERDDILGTESWYAHLLCTKQVIAKSNCYHYHHRHHGNCVLSDCVTSSFAFYPTSFPGLSKEKEGSWEPSYS